MLNTNSGPGGKKPKNLLTYAVILVFFLVIILFGAKDYLPKFAGADKVSGGYVTAKEAKDIVREFIEENPELIVKSVENMQRKAHEERMQRSKERIKENRELINSTAFPVIGNEEGDVTIVKFYDYRCGHCKNAHKTLSSIMSKDGKIKIVLRVVPVLGPESEKAARASLAAHDISPSKFEKFHEKLLTAATYNENNIKKLATESGYDPDVLIGKMNSKEVTDQLEENRRIAGIVGVQGVPAFLVKEEFVPGSLPEEEFKKVIAKVREAK